MDAASGAGALRTAVEERDEWKEEAVRLSAAVSEHEESIAHWTGEYEDLQFRSAAPRRRGRGHRNGTRGHSAPAGRRHGRRRRARESLAEREHTLADTLARLQAGEREASARETRLEALLAERERVVSEAHARVDAAEERLRNVAAELDQARLERESWLVETERLSSALDVREVELADLRRSFDAQRIELENARLQLDAVTTQLEQAAAERKDVAKGRRTAPGNARRSARGPCSDAGRECGTRAHLREHERSLARTREEALQLAVALAEEEEALARGRSCTSATSSCASRSPNCRT